MHRRKASLLQIILPRLRAALEQAKKDADLKAYDGHDTVCVLAAKDNEMAAGVSTSGLFLKHAGRVGDSPVIGSGFYSDAMAGSAAATGLGEDIMRGCLSVRGC